MSAQRNILFHSQTLIFGKNFYKILERSLNEICEKLHLSLNLDMQPVNMVKEYPILKWDEIKQRTKSQKNDWIKKYNMKGAIA